MLKAITLSRSRMVWDCLSRTHAEPPGPAPTKIVEMMAWVCSVCQAECIPIRSESRCMCGHRHKEHEAAKASGSKARCVAAAHAQPRAAEACQAAAIHWLTRLGDRHTYV